MGGVWLCGTVLEMPLPHWLNGALAALFLGIAAFQAWVEKKRALDAALQKNTPRNMLNDLAIFLETGLELKKSRGIFGTGPVAGIDSIKGRDSGNFETSFNQWDASVVEYLRKAGRNLEAVEFTHHPGGGNISINAPPPIEMIIYGQLTGRIEGLKKIIETLRAESRS